MKPLLLDASEPQLLLLSLASVFYGTCIACNDHMNIRIGMHRVEI